MKWIKILFLVLFFCACKYLRAQNLFANSGFEAINNCIEYKADCAPEAWFNIPAGNFLVNSRKASNPLLGNMVLIIPAGNVVGNFNIPRYVYTALCCPLTADNEYKLSFYINTSTHEFTGLSIYFTDTEPYLSTVNKLPETPSIVIAKENLTELPSGKWQHVEYSYKASGKEKFFFFTTRGLPRINYNMEDAMNKSGDVLYFIDEIKLLPVNTLPLCAEYEKNIERLFSYNYRHSDNYPIINEEEPVKPVISLADDTITIPGLLFDVNKSNVKAPVKKILDSLIIALQQRNFTQINITGHTDSTGNGKDNQLLSDARAISIKNYLAQKLPADKLTAAGKGFTQPVTSNSTAINRQHNRRVEIVITYLKQLN